MPNGSELVGVLPHKDRGRVEITGAEEANWGAGAGPQNTIVGALDAVCRLFHFPGIDYVALMGVSGHAFRIQASVNGLSASAANALCGRKTADRALAAVPLSWTVVPAGQAGTMVAEEAIHTVAAAIDKGFPVLAVGEETDLVVGHFHDHLFGRTADSVEPGYSALHTWPNTFMIPEARQVPPSPRDQIRAGLEAAVADWHCADATDGYYCGARAYEEWRKKLSPEALQTLDVDTRWRYQHANAFMMECLVDARRTASAFLRRVSNALGPAAHDALIEAAAVYESIVEDDLTTHDYVAVAPYSWMCDHEHPWSDEWRTAQIEHLIEAEERDARAIDILARAIA